MQLPIIRTIRGSEQDSFARGWDANQPLPGLPIILAFSQSPFFIGNVGQEVMETHTYFVANALGGLAGAAVGVGACIALHLGLWAILGALAGFLVGFLATGAFYAPFSREVATHRVSMVGSERYDGVTPEQARAKTIRSLTGPSYRNSGQTPDSIGKLLDDPAERLEAERWWDERPALVARLKALKAYPSWGI